MRFHYFILILFLCTGTNKFVFAQEFNKDEESLNIMFYNTENLYDTFDDSLTNDNDFLPQGKMHWTKNKYEQKLNNLCKVILSSGIEPPAIIGMSEIENKKVLFNLCNNTPLTKFNYKIIHSNSPDSRGIDVSVIYRPQLFKPVKTEFIRIVFSNDSLRKTRDILYIKGIAANCDTLHLFFNHWPSRRGGEIESQPFRNFVAKQLRFKVDSIFTNTFNPQIIIMGDFNDEPDNESMLNYLKTLTYNKNIENYQLYNLSASWLNQTEKTGTHKFKGKWAVLDQIIVSSELLNTSTNGLKCKAESAIIHNSPFLLEDDNVYGGVKPFRTYSGFKYLGGYSDHLPIILSCISKNK
jgi:predicted extracellular nuclease